MAGRQSTFFADTPHGLPGWQRIGDSAGGEKEPSYDGLPCLGLHEVSRKARLKQ